MKEMPLSIKGFVGIALFILFLLFQPQILSLYDSLIVEGLKLNEVQGSGWNYFLMIVLVELTIFLLICIYYYEIRIRNEMALLSAIVFCLYCYYRFFGDRYNFIAYEKIPQVKFADYVLVLTGSMIGLWLYNRYTSFRLPDDKKKPFLVDAPIISSGEDMFNRQGFAKLISQKVQSRLISDHAGALAIGINGDWGSGKTSFANMIREDINPENRIIIDFNPWRSSSPTRVIEDFFELLIADLKKYDPTLSRNIADYAKTLTSINENAISKTIETISDYLFESTSKNENYDEINASIQRIKKQIIIFIDDLDRLDKKEIVEVLRIIRNTASFNNVVYVVAYDKRYVLEAVRDFNAHNYEYFLEKVFQFEFLLPACDPDVLRKNLIKNLTDSLDEALHPMINAAVGFRVAATGQIVTNSIIRTQRDIIRFSNSLLIEFERVKYHVNFIDFFLIQMLKLKFDGVVKYLADHRRLFFITRNNQLHLRKVEELSTSESEGFEWDTGTENRTGQGERDDNSGNYIFHEYIRSLPEGQVTPVQKDIIKDIVNELMKEKVEKIGSESKDSKSLINHSNLEYYFNLQVLTTEFSFYSLDQARMLSYRHLEKTVTDLLDSGRKKEVVDYFEKIIDFTTPEEWENHVRILIAIGKHILTNTNHYEVNFRQIIDVLNYPLRTRKITLFDNETDYQNKVKEIFSTAKEPYILESYILTTVLVPTVRLTGMEVEEVMDQLLTYLEQYCIKHPEVTAELRTLHNNCVKPVNGGQDFEIQEKGNALFKEHFRKYLKGSQLDGFISPASFDLGTYQLDIQWMNVFFGDLTGFETYFESADNLKKDSDHYREFSDFYLKCKKNGYQPVEYKFEHLQPKSRMIF